MQTSRPGCFKNPTVWWYSSYSVWWKIFTAIKPRLPEILPAAFKYKERVHLSAIDSNRPESSNSLTSSARSRQHDLELRTFLDYSSEWSGWMISTNQPTNHTDGSEHTNSPTSSWVRVSDDGIAIPFTTCQSKLIQYSMVCEYGSILPKGTNCMKAKLIDSIKI